MTWFLLILGGGWPVAAFCAYQWWKADMDVEVLEERCHHLIKLNKKAHDAMRGRVQARPAPDRWGQRPYDRLIEDMGLNPLPDSPRLSLVHPDDGAGREAHSHAERGTIQ